MSARSVPTWLIVFLSLLAGVGLGAGGLAGGLEIDDRLERRAQQERSLRYRALDTSHLTEVRRQDSLLAATDGFSQDPRPFEMGRRQVHHACVVTLLLHDDRMADLQLLHVNARHMDGHVAGRAYAYSETGFPKGTVVNVLFSQTPCSSFRIMGWGGSRAQSAPPMTVR